MTVINDEGYVVRNCEQRAIGQQRGKGEQRNWWLVKCGCNGSGTLIGLGKVSIPLRYVGKKIRFKIEVVENE